jgi:hypothetical protein
LMASGAAAGADLGLETPLIWGCSPHRARRRRIGKFRRAGGVQQQVDRRGRRSLRRRAARCDAFRRAGRVGRAAVRRDARDLGGGGVAGARRRRRRDGQTLDAPPRRRACRAAWRSVRRRLWCGNPSHRGPLPGGGGGLCAARVGSEERVLGGLELEGRRRIVILQSGRLGSVLRHAGCSVRDHVDCQCAKRCPLPLARRHACVAAADSSEVQA